MSGARHASRVVACVPAYRAAAFIEETLRALAAQKYPGLRVLVSVDRCDGADDETGPICDRFARNDRRFSVIHQPARLGWIGNVNALLARAMPEADLLMISPHDDLPEPEYVTRLADALANRARASLAFSDIEIEYPGGHRAVQSYDALEGIACRVERGRRLLALDRGWWTPFRGLFPAETARRIGGLRRHVAGEFAADWPFLLHLALLGEFVRVPEVLYRKRFRRESLSLQWSYDAKRWNGAALSCARTILVSDLSVRERAMLLTTLVRRHRAFLAERRMRP
jgi:glycosyltransferase involved in cell wall biosynthesis